MNTVKTLSYSVAISTLSMIGAVRAADLGQLSSDRFVTAVMVTHSEPVAATAERRAESDHAQNGPDLFVTAVLKTSTAPSRGTGQGVRDEELSMVANSAEWFVAKVLTH